MDQDRKTPSWLAIFFTALLTAALAFGVGALATMFILSDGGVDWGRALGIAAAPTFAQVVVAVAQRNGWLPRPRSDR